MTPEIRMELENLQRKARETGGNLSLEECRRVVVLLREGRLSIPLKEKAEAKEKRQLKKETEKASQPQILFDDI